MKKNIKLTDLNHFETLKVEMAFVKGGGDPDGAPVTCFGCNCTCTCSGTASENKTDSTYNSSRNGGVIHYALQRPIDIVKEIIN